MLGKQQYLLSALGVVETDSVPTAVCGIDTGTLRNSGYCNTVCLCVLCGSENKQRLFPYTALTDWFV